MTFIVEDNTGLIDANSFVSIEYADSYFGDRGNIDWGGVSTFDAKRSLLIIATDYIETVYAQAFTGKRYSEGQALSFPRYVDGKKCDVPDRLKKAVCELAVKAIEEPLLEDTGKNTIEETVGSITVKYSEYGSQTTQYNAVFKLLQPYISVLSSSAYKAVRT